MSLTTIGGDGVLFGLNIPERINAFLQAAALRPGDTEWAEGNLKRALAENPEQLETYVALYKLYCYSGRFDEAETMARTALAKAAAQAGVAADWRLLAADSTDWSQPDGPARLLLYSLKALAFISLRQQRPDQAGDILKLLARLDPQDRVGASVVREMAGCLMGDEQDDERDDD